MGPISAGRTRVRSRVMVWHWKRLLLLSGLCWAGFAVVLAVAYWLPAAQWADGWAVKGFLTLERPWLDAMALRVARLADPAPFAFWTALLAAFALYRRQLRHAVAVIVLLGGANVIAQGLKMSLHHERWHSFLGGYQLGPSSFPSGHATASMALAFAALLVTPAAWRRIVAIAGAIFAVAVSESVMLLAWHFPSDVVGGFLVATACALATVAALQVADERWPQRTGRQAARRAIRGIDLRRTGAVVAGLVVAVVAGVVLAAGARAVHFADHHTTAVLAAAAVAAMAAALPVSVAALGARRP
jgi:membrane-associated phospholipid phosphatase